MYTKLPLTPHREFWRLYNRYRRMIWVEDMDGRQIWNCTNYARQIAAGLQLSYHEARTAIACAYANRVVLDSQFAVSDPSWWHVAVLAHELGHVNHPSGTAYPVLHAELCAWQWAKDKLRYWDADMAKRAGLCLREYALSHRGDWYSDTMDQYHDLMMPKN